MDFVYGCLQILAVAYGGPTIIMGFMHMAAGNKRVMARVLWGAALVTAGLATPGGFGNVNPWLPVY